jgi:hypothetical protein
LAQKSAVTLTIRLFSALLVGSTQFVEYVLQRLENACLKLQPDECFIAQPEVEYLGFIVSSSGAKANLAKFQAVRDYPVPKNEKDVRVLLGLPDF